MALVFRTFGIQTSRLNIWVSEEKDSFNRFFQVKSNFEDQEKDSLRDVFACKIVALGK